MLFRSMGKADYQRVLDEMRLTSGNIFPIPITLSVDSEAGVEQGQEIALRNSKYELLAVMTVEDIYEWDQSELCQKVFGSEDSRHPLVAEMHKWGKLNISGKLQVIELPKHFDYQNLRKTPAQAREKLREIGCKNIVAFQTRNPLHRVQDRKSTRLNSSH